jgi:hypothetical protein
MSYIALINGSQKWDNKSGCSRIVSTDLVWQSGGSGILFQSKSAFYLGLVGFSLALALVVSLVPSLSPVSRAGVASAGCCGDLQVHKDAGEPDPMYASISSMPEVGLFHLHAFSFDADATVEWVITRQSDGAQVLDGALTLQADGTGQTGQLSLPNGPYVVVYHEVGCPGGDKIQEFLVARQPVDVVGTVTPTSEPDDAIVPCVIPTTGPAQVSVLCYGCWSSSAEVWVGGTEQPSQSLAPDASGVLAALWTFWNDETWQIRVRVTLPAELDANRWKLIMWVGTGPQDYIWADETTFNLAPHQLTKVVFQLVDTYLWQ